MSQLPSYKWICLWCQTPNVYGTKVCASCGRPENAHVPDHSGSPAATARAAPQTEMALEFNGKAREYFRIWIVNLCLTLLSLGIFSAWAKVRKKRYFYSHTLLDGTPFQWRFHR